MKRCCVRAVLLGVISFVGFAALVQRAAAQATAFTYQGRLAGSEGQGLTGEFDFQFQLFNATTNQVGTNLTSLAVGVTNGLFTTSLDFGAAALSGTPLYLQIGVRTNGSTGDFTLLSPMQPLDSAPYAYRAGVATSYPGAITDSQLSANIPRLNSASIFTAPVTLNSATGAFVGTFSGAASGTFNGAASGTFNGTAGGIINGNGAGLTNINITNVIGILPNNPAWQVVQGTNQQTASGVSYLSTNPAMVSLTLPASPSVGDALRVSGAGAGGWKLVQNTNQSILAGSLGLPAGPAWSSRSSSQPWQSLASSADGSRMAAAIKNGYIFISPDSGATWAQQNGAGSRQWNSIACSTDGSRLIAAALNDFLYISTDGGTTWVQRATSTAWTSAASSSDGSKLVAAVNNGFIYTSVNSGTNWTQSGASSQPWVSVASSGDGTMLAGAVNNGFIFTSSNSGSNWVQHATSQPWISIASSANGNRLLAVANNGGLFVSGDAGANWIQRFGTQVWESCACSADGSKMAAVVYGGQIYTSFDSGQTWVARDATRYWQCVAYSGNGARAVAAEQNGLIYVSTSSTTIGSAGYLSGIQYSALELQYIGNGQWMPLSFSGSFSGN